MKRRVVITGGAGISALGIDWTETELSLRTCENKVVTMKEWEKYPKVNTRLGAPISNWNEPNYPRKKIRGMGRVALMAVNSADMALQMSGLADDPVITKGRHGIAYGSSAGSVDASMEFFSVLNNTESKGLNATTYIRSMPQTCAVNIGIFFGLTGRLLTTNTACTAGSLSIGLGYEAIANGQQDVMICGGAEELNVTGAAVFDTLFATSTKNDSPKLSPAAFDRDRDGLVIGEGAGTLILEELQHAKARGATILMEIVGFGTNTDGSHVTQPNKATMQISMELALQSAQLSPDAIGYVNAHGTATTHGDVAETQATRACFSRRVPISSQKSYIGHTLGACGALETWFTINMMKQKWFAPNLNLNNLDPACGDLDYLTGKGYTLDTEYAMCNNFAFGGINTSIILKRWG